MAQPRVFVSHASEDARFANQLAEDLRFAGADVWLDSSHMGSGDFVARINQALQSRDVVVLVLSPAAIQSKWVSQEFNAAIARTQQGLMRPPIVVMASPCRVADIPPLWTVYHRYDASNDFAGALHGVVRELGLSTPTVGTAPSTSAPVSRAPAVPAEATWSSQIIRLAPPIAVIGLLVLAVVLIQTPDSAALGYDPLVTSIACVAMTITTIATAIFAARRALSYPGIAAGVVAAQAFAVCALATISWANTLPSFRNSGYAGETFEAVLEIIYAVTIVGAIAAAIVRAVQNKALAWIVGILVYSFGSPVLPGALSGGAGTTIVQIAGSSLVALIPLGALLFALMGPTTSGLRRKD